MAREQCMLDGDIAGPGTCLTISDAVASSSRSAGGVQLALKLPNGKAKRVDVDPESLFCKATGITAPDITKSSRQRLVVARHDRAFCENVFYEDNVYTDLDLFCPIHLAKANR